MLQRKRRVRAIRSNSQRLNVFATRSAALLLAVAAASAQTVFLRERVSLSTNQNFCVEGVYPSTTWPKDKPAGLNAWGSYCREGDRGTGMAATAPFPAPAHLRLYLAGYPSFEGMALRIESVTDGAKFSIEPAHQPGEHWVLSDFAVPRSWQHKMIRIVAEDHRTTGGGWLGFSEPLASPAGMAGFDEAQRLLLRTILHFVLTMLPCFAVCAFVIGRGVREPILAGFIALAVSGVSGYLVFWLWFLWPRVGHVVAFFLPLFSILCLICYGKRLDSAGGRILKALVAPALLTGATSALILSTGFAFGGLTTPLTTPWTRFSHPLPPDNTVPFLFAEAVRPGKIPKPLLGDWQSSDRPPLQAGIALSQYPYSAAPRALSYTILASNLQSLWIFALWFALLAFGVDKRAAVLVLSVCLLWGFTFVNTFFVWPKLLAASYTLAAAAIFLSGRLARPQVSSNLLAVTAGALVAFGLLAHGGSVFALLGLALTIPVLRKRVSLKALFVLTATSFALYFPWLLYQKLFDPPGDRLLKWHLAGVEKPDPHTFFQVLATAYGKLNAHEILHHKVQNATAVVDHNAEYWRTLAQSMSSFWKQDSDNEGAQAAFGMRISAFFFFIPSLGFLVIGIPFLLMGIDRRRRSPEWKIAITLWVFVFFTAVLWCLLMFGPSSTVLHQGTYVMPLLGATACVLGAWALSPRLAYVICALQVALNFLLYIVMMRQPVAGGALPEGLPRYAMVAFALLSLASIFFLLRIMARGSAPPAR